MQRIVKRRPTPYREAKTSSTGDLFAGDGLEVLKAKKRSFLGSRGLGPLREHESSALVERAPSRLRVGTLSWLVFVVLVLVSAGCATEFPGEDPALDRFEYPSGIAVHPDGKTLYVVSANFDLKFRHKDGGTLTVIDLETGNLLSEQTLTLGSFASNLVLNEDATRGYITVRGDSSLTWFALDTDGRNPHCPLAPESDDLRECRFNLPDEPTDLAYQRTSRLAPQVDNRGVPLIGEDGEPLVVEQELDLLTVAHLEGGLVSVVVVGEGEGLQEPSVSVASAALVDAPSSVARHRGDRFYVTGRAAQNLVAFRPAIGEDAQALGVYVERTLTVPSPYSSYEGRSLIFDGEGDRLYMTNQSPNSLVVFDTSEGDNDTVSGRHNRVIDTIDLPTSSDRMAWVSREGASSLLYITSFQDDVITIVDVDIPAVVGKARVGEGPYEVVVDERAKRAYVSNFSDNTVSVLDLSDPAVPEEIQVIGVPR